MSHLFRTRWWALALAGLLVGCSVVSPSAGPQTPFASGRSEPFKIVGYVTPAANLADIDFTRVTHINYAFLLPRANGTFHPFGAPRHLKQTVELARVAGAKVLISIGGWGWDKEFEAMATKKETRARFIANVIDFVAAYNLDGVDIDWEYPNAGASADNFLSLMQELRESLPKQSLLSTAVIARAGDANGVLPEVFQQLDYVNVMAYDDGGDQHSSYALAEDAVRSWISRGLPREKCVLGVPFYSRPGNLPYRKLFAYDKAAAESDHLYYFTTEQFYNGPATLKRKTQLAMAEAGGIMIWELSQDAPKEGSLLKVIAETVQDGP